MSNSEVFIDAVDVVCAQLTRDLFAIAKFLVQTGTGGPGARA